MALVLGLILLAAFVLTMYVWTPKTGKGIILYCALVLLFGLIIWVARHFSR
jgi:hypothetical protein